MGVADFQAETTLLPKRRRGDKRPRQVEINPSLIFQVIINIGMQRKTRTLDLSEIIIFNELVSNMSSYYHAGVDEHGVYH